MKNTWKEEAKSERNLNIFPSETEAGRQETQTSGSKVVLFPPLSCENVDSIKHKRFSLCSEESCHGKKGRGGIPRLKVSFFREGEESTAHRGQRHRDDDDDDDDDGDGDDDDDCRQ